MGLLLLLATNTPVSVTPASSASSSSGSAAITAHPSVVPQVGAAGSGATMAAGAAATILGASAASLSGTGLAFMVAAQLQPQADAVSGAFGQITLALQVVPGTASSSSDATLIWTSIVGPGHEGQHGIGRRTPSSIGRSSRRTSGHRGFSPVGHSAISQPGHRNRGF